MDAVAVVSVITSGLVALSSAFVRPMIDWIRWERERASSALERIDDATIELLHHLSYLRHWVIKDIQEAAGMSIFKVFSILPARHYAWERAVWSSLDPAEREGVRRLRKRFEEVHTPDALKDQLSDITDEILSLTHAATGRVGKKHSGSRYGRRCS